MTAESLGLRAADGVEVAADIWIAEGAWAGAVVCHPHPSYGGDRHNIVVDRVSRALAGAGATVLRFDFRSGVGEGEGDGRLDVVAGLDAVAAELGPGVPLWLVGYSFGADVALSVGDERVAGWAVAAPPLHFGAGARPADGDPRPVLVVAAEHDQFAPPDRLRAAIAGWPDAQLAVVAGADHFMAGATDRVATEILTWLRNRSPEHSG